MWVCPLLREKKTTAAGWRSIEGSGTSVDGPMRYPENFSAFRINHRKPLKTNMAIAGKKSTIFDRRRYISKWLVVPLSCSVFWGVTSVPQKGSTSEHRRNTRKTESSCHGNLRIALTMPPTPRKHNG